MDFLELELSVLLVVLRESVLDGFLELVLDVSPDVSDLDLCLLSNLVALLGELTAPLFCGLRDVQADDFSVVFRRDAHIAVHDGLLNVADGFLVPRSDGDGACVGAVDIGHLVERDSLSIGLHSHAVEDGDVCPAGADAVEAFIEEHGCHLHAFLCLVECCFYVDHSVEMF